MPSQSAPDQIDLPWATGSSLARCRCTDRTEVRDPPRVPLRGTGAVRQRRELGDLDGRQIEPIGRAAKRVAKAAAKAAR